MFAVDDIDETLDRLRKRDAQRVGEVVQYEDSYRLCYIRGPEGLLIGLARARQRLLCVAYATSFFCMTRVSVALPSSVSGFFHHYSASPLTAADLSNAPRALNFFGPKCPR